MLYCIYNVKFNPAGLNATSIAGSIEEQTVSLDFKALADDKGVFYYCVDTAETGADTIATSWFQQVPTVR